MGVINVTPDSFSDGGRFYQRDAAVAQGLKLVQEGADILDVGGESTRPFSEPLPAEEEIRRVLPVIEKLSPQVSVPISIDTNKAQVARQALAAGAAMINDISALRFDPDMVRVAAEHQVPVVLMHMKGTPKNMQIAPRYDNLMGEIQSFLSQAAARAQAEGIPRTHIIIDPGVGFGKTFHHNLVLINRLNELKSMGFPLLVGPSRKAFIRNILKGEGEADIDPDSEIVEAGTQAVIAAAALKGADIVRVHDVARTRPTVALCDAIKKASVD
ncbi:MAG: dihydropteroate synthase [Thermodesulfobacteriota bacterium]